MSWWLAKALSKSSVHGQMTNVLVEQSQNKGLLQKAVAISSILQIIGTYAYWNTKPSGSYAPAEAWYSTISGIYSFETRTKVQGKKGAVGLAVLPIATARQFTQMCLSCCCMVLFTITVSFCPLIAFVEGKVCRDQLQCHSDLLPFHKLFLWRWLRLLSCWFKLSKSFQNVFSNLTYAHARVVLGCDRF